MIEWKYNKQFDSEIRFLGLSSPGSTRCSLKFHIEALDANFYIQPGKTGPLLHSMSNGLAFVRLRMCSTVKNPSQYPCVPGTYWSARFQLAVEKVY